MKHGERFQRRIIKVDAEEPGQPAPEDRAADDAGSESSSSSSDKSQKKAEEDDEDEDEEPLIPLVPAFTFDSLRIRLEERERRDELEMHIVKLEERLMRVKGFESV